MTGHGTAPRCSYFLVVAHMLAIRLASVRSVTEGNRMMQPGRRTSMLTVLLFLTLVGTASAEAQHAPAELAFHQAVRASPGLTAPRGFERVKRPAEETRLYVARTAALVIHSDNITMVVITRKPIYADLPSITESTRRQLGLPGQPQPIRVIGFYYVAVVHVNAHAARRLHTLTANSVGQIVDIRFTGTRLAVTRIYGPVASGQMAIPLTEWTRAEIEQAFAVLKPRLTWTADPH